MVKYQLLAHNWQKRRKNVYSLCYIEIQNERNEIVGEIGFPCGTYRKQGFKKLRGNGGKWKTH